MWHTVINAGIVFGISALMDSLGCGWWTWQYWCMVAITFGLIINNRRRGYLS